MINKNFKNDLVKTIIDDVENDMTDEEIVHIILDKKMSRNEHTENKDSFGQKAADSLARFAGSWKFVIGFTIVLICWILVNAIMLTKPFDPFPFILLNLVLSCIAAIQAPLIMMSQNRQEQKDRKRAENDYRVNLKNEIIIQDMHTKLDQVIENQEKILNNKK